VSDVRRLEDLRRGAEILRASECLWSKSEKIFHICLTESALFEAIFDSYKKLNKMILKYENSRFSLSTRPIQKKTFFFLILRFFIKFIFKLANCDSTPIKQHFFVCEFQVRSVAPSKRIKDEHV